MPEIINVAPATNLPLLLGLADTPANNDPFQVTDNDSPFDRRNGFSDDTGDRVSYLN